MNYAQNFIIKAKEKFKDKFDYSKVIYKNLRTPVTIICSKHGEFNITPHDFLASKFGCKSCYIDNKKSIKYNTQEFIEKAKLIHGDKFIYDKVNYTGSENPIIVTCKIHGDFETIPSRLLSKHGCPKCKSDITRKYNISKRDSLEDFILKVIDTYGNGVFNFDKVNYINSRTEVLIYSYISGKYFKITPSRLLAKNIKKEHYGEQIVSLNLTNEEYINRAKLKYGDKYNYNKTKYISMRDLVLINCPIHGDFSINAANHLNGLGCQECGKISSGLKHRKLFENFINDARKVHGDKYLYIENSFTKSSDYVTIICPKHGEFSLLACAHTLGLGCPICNSSKGETIISNYLTSNNIEYISQYEINIDKSINPSGKAYIDFFLPNYNIAIEYNGVLHYEYTPFFHRGGVIDFKRLLIRDLAIEKYCNTNKILLLSFKYTEILKLEKLIENELKNRIRFR